MKIFLCVCKLLYTHTHHTLYTCHTLQAILKTLHYTLCTTSYTVYTTLHNMRYALRTICTLCTIHFTLCTVHHALYTVHHTLHTIHCTPCTIGLASYARLCHITARYISLLPGVGAPSCLFYGNDMKGSAVRMYYTQRTDINIR